LTNKALRGAPVKAAGSGERRPVANRSTARRGMPTHRSIRRINFQFTFFVPGRRYSRNSMVQPLYASCYRSKDSFHAILLHGVQVSQSNISEFFSAGLRVFSVKNPIRFVPESGRSAILLTFGKNLFCHKRGFVKAGSPKAQRKNLNFRRLPPWSLCALWQILTSHDFIII
jgi:hypothetical protein